MANTPPSESNVNFTFNDTVSVFIMGVIALAALAVFVRTLEHHRQLLELISERD